jgi:hypothetical protein
VDLLENRPIVRLSSSDLAVSLQGKVTKKVKFVTKQVGRHKLIETANVLREQMADVSSNLKLSQLMHYNSELMKNLMMDLLDLGQLENGKF